MLGTKCITSEAGKGQTIPPVRVGNKLWDDLEDHLRRIPDASRSDFVRRAIRETITRDRLKQWDREVRMAGARARAEGLFVEAAGEV